MRHSFGVKRTSRPSVFRWLSTPVPNVYTGVLPNPTSDLPCQIRHEQLLRRNVNRFRGGLVFKAHRRVYHSTLGSRVIKRIRHGGFRHHRARGRGGWGRPVDGVGRAVLRLVRLVRWRSRSRWRERLRHLILSRWRERLRELILSRWRERFREVSHVLLIEACEEPAHAVPLHHLHAVVHVGFQAREGAAGPGFYQRSEFKKRHRPTGVLTDPDPCNSGRSSEPRPPFVD